jgi:hypothetical protein
MKETRFGAVVANVMSVAARGLGLFLWYFLRLIYRGEPKVVAGFAAVRGGDCPADLADRAMTDSALNPLLLSIAVVAMFALVWGGIRTWRGGERQKGVLMVIAALVLLGNLLIWSI